MSSLSLREKNGQPSSLYSEELLHPSSVRHMVNNVRLNIDPLPTLLTVLLTGHCTVTSSCITRNTV